MQKNPLRLLAALFLSCLLLAACDQQALIDKFAPKEQTAQAKHIFEQLAQRDFEGVESQFAPELRASATREQLEAVAGFIPAGAALEVKTVGAYSTVSTEGNSYNLSFEYRYANSWLLYNVVMREKDGKTLVVGLHVQPLSQSTQEPAPFTLAGKSLLHYAVLGWAIANPLFMLTTAVFCARTLKTRRKWLAVLFILIGVGGLSLNWGTGEWAFHPLMFNLLGAGFLKAAPGAPFVFTVGFPLGAILFWLHKAGAFSDAQKVEAEAEATQAGEDRP